MMNKKPKLLTQLRNEIRTLGYSWNTEKTYVHWVRDYVIFHNKTASFYARAGRGEYLPQSPGQSQP